MNPTEELASLNKDDESTAELDSSETFDCPICQEVLRMPVMTQSCKHVFCKSCFLTAVRTRGLQCPMCRGPVKENEKKATAVSRRMNIKKGKCRACSAEMYFSKMRSHYKYCQLYKDEYGILLATPVVPRSQITGRVSVPMNRRSYDNNGQIMQSLRETYSCPYCQLMGLSDTALLSHCNSYHTGNHTSVVCPICSSMPWGDSNYPSRNFVEHLNLRHRFNYADYVNIHEEEDLHLETAIEESIAEWNNGLIGHLV
ncbi:E3 ubiquitin-protein ligase RNF138-like [Erpetoichthys calabaricus]|uniref:E3 ubiquitin-protein ligase RNF138-like n=1 Tax=Erpetoichthys calabaricus TaxID=27687 RepID=UPI00109F3D8D|nr:E3 ubiquitin-protein ligase RNF138-like [Erpetoichthys calabaricus]XP_051785118.1 E3 ubiquitin-protein ligase RNF138-like [Erpetoichthys calabaricus]XP_051785119.1 E3 ubiquitin-protein ligase RNF138-like [Erpetoichthys calabaricus]XP_051785120.1 E3 ubiquitin-protein ligase RNF138-like [Erpetoichthys calabaricus]